MQKNRADYQYQTTIPRLRIQSKERLNWFCSLKPSVKVVCVKNHIKAMMAVGISGSNA